MSWLRRRRFAFAALAFPLAFVSPASAGVLPVSPGAADRLVEVSSACPAFSWAGVEGAVAYELAVLDVADSENPVLVFSERIDGSAYAWTPSRDRCLAPGRTYAWLVRADVTGGGLGEWSAPRRFRVPGAPSLDEVSAALEVLERWRATQGAGAGTGGTATAAAGLMAPTPAPKERATGAAEAPLATGVAAIRGEIPDTSGSAYGLFGITHSAAGAGVVARNEAAGPDLVLDGAAQGQVDTLLTQSGIDRPSMTDNTFDITNSFGGRLTLRVEGTPVAVEGHDHRQEIWYDSDFILATTPIGTGTSALLVWSQSAAAALEARSDASGPDLRLMGFPSMQTAANFNETGIDRPSSYAETFDITNSGAGTMTLLVDGVPVSTSSHVHAGEAITSGTVADDRIAPTLTRDSEAMTIVLANDGAGSGLDADTLDGSHGYSFAPAGHDHFGYAWSGETPYFGLGITNNHSAGFALAATNYYGTALVAGGGGAYKGAVVGQNDDDYGRGVHGLTQGALGFGVFGEASAPFGSAAGVYGTSASPGGLGGYFHNYSGGGALFVEGNGPGRNLAALQVRNNLASTGIAAYVTNSSAVATAHFANSGAGEVLYLQNGGTDEYGAGGNDFIRAVNNPENDSQFRVLTDGEVRSDYGFYTPAADFAEMLPAEPGLEPGDVLAIGSDGKLMRSAAAFSPKVAGVYSTAPGFVGGHPVDGEAPGDHVPLAVVGIVPVKVSAENGAIAPGDLLVSSATPGHAMRAGGLAPNGTVIGKALETHAEGSGRIRMLLVLQ